MERLSGLDAAFLALETASMHMHVGSLLVLDPASSPGWSFERLEALVAARLDLLKPLRRRAVEVPFGLYHPLWVEDPDFRLERHLIRRTLPAPGDACALASCVGEAMSRPLERSRPLWELWMLDGLADGRLAVVAKVHHAAADGVSGAALAETLLDRHPDPRRLRKASVSWQPEGVPSQGELVLGALGALAVRSAEALQLFWRAANAARGARTEPEPPRRGGPPAPFSGPRTSLNAALGPTRHVGFATMDLERVRAVAHARGATVNDVVLALCAGSLRAYLRARGELPGRPLVALVPISVRTGNVSGANQLSAMLVRLPTQVGDPLQRLRAISLDTTRAKQRRGPTGPVPLVEWARLVSPALTAGLSRLASGLRIFDALPPLCNVVVSNVPGPRSQLWSAGALLEHFYPLGPLAEGSGLNITAMSYAGALQFGLDADPGVVPELGGLAEGLGSALGDLERALRRAGRSEHSVIR